MQDLWRVVVQSACGGEDVFFEVSGGPESAEVTSWLVVISLLVLVLFVVLALAR